MIKDHFYEETDEYTETAYAVLIWFREGHPGGKCPPRPEKWAHYGKAMDRYPVEIQQEFRRPGAAPGRPLRAPPRAGLSRTCHLRGRTPVHPAHLRAGYGGAFAPHEVGVVIAFILA